MLVAAAGQKGRKPPNEEATNHFYKMLEAPCSNHHYPVQRAYKDCGLLRNFLSREASSGRCLEPQGGGEQEIKILAFPDKTECLLVFGKPEYYASKRHQKLE
jgi:hypothetical protein